MSNGKKTESSGPLKSAGFLNDNPNGNPNRNPNSKENGKKNGAPYGNQNAKGYGAPQGNQNAKGYGAPEGNLNRLKNGQYAYNLVNALLHLPDLSEAYSDLPDDPMEQLKISQALDTVIQMRITKVLQQLYKADWIDIGGLVADGLPEDPEDLSDLLVSGTNTEGFPLDQQIEEMVMDGPSGTGSLTSRFIRPIGLCLTMERMLSQIQDKRLKRIMVFSQKKYEDLAEQRKRDFQDLKKERLQTLTEYEDAKAAIVRYGEVFRDDEDNSLFCKDTIGD